ncbi:hypothetical protein FORC36_4916 (plasmid) [Vibrio vulnificus]|nr:hypothetical protein FORC36_4916 [Vibrio vulnificus]
MESHYHKCEVEKTTLLRRGFCVSDKEKPKKKRNIVSEAIYRLLTKINIDSQA